ncbi:MAG: hypothetical protein U0900_15295 [Myxococcota bacterium]
MKKTRHGEAFEAMIFGANVHGCERRVAPTGSCRIEERGWLSAAIRERGGCGTTNSMTSSTHHDHHDTGSSDRRAEAASPRSIRLIRWNDASSETIVVRLAGDGGTQDELDAAIAVGFRILRERPVE